MRSTTEADADRQRVAEIEAMLRDPSGAGQRRYWNDAALRGNYAEALGRLAGERLPREGATPAPADTGENAASEKSGPAKDSATLKSSLVHGGSTKEAVPVS